MVLPKDFPEEIGGAASIRANRAKRTISEWGKKLFRETLGAKAARRIWRVAERVLSDTDIQIHSTAAHVDQIPWEILQDPHSGHILSLWARSFTRFPYVTNGPLRTTREAGPTRLLFVISWPSETVDVSFRSIASKVFRRIQASGGFEITVLTPPTFSQCAQTLRDSHSAGRPFDIVHFDGHGLHLEPSEKASGAGSAYTAGGYIVFEDEGDDEFRLISGQEFGALMAETGVNTVVLNACRSAHVGVSRSEGDESERGGLVSSFAHDVVRLGTPTVVAMQYNVYVSSAARFNEELYRQLARGQTVASATALARKHLASDLRRDSEIDSSTIPDWIVPAVFQNRPEAPLVRVSPGHSTVPVPNTSEIVGSLPPVPI